MQTRAFVCVRVCSVRRIETPVLTDLVRVRLKIIGNLETMHDSDLPTFLIISLPIICKRIVDISSRTREWDLAVQSSRQERAVPLLFNNVQYVYT